MRVTILLGCLLMGCSSAPKGGAFKVSGTYKEATKVAENRIQDECLDAGGDMYSMYIVREPAYAPVKTPTFDISFECIVAEVR